MFDADEVFSDTPPKASTGPHPMDSIIDPATIGSLKTLNDILTQLQNPNYQNKIESLGLETKQVTAITQGKDLTYIGELLALPYSNHKEHTLRLTLTDYLLTQVGINNFEQLFHDLRELFPELLEIVEACQTKGEDFHKAWAYLMESVEEDLQNFAIMRDNQLWRTGVVTIEIPTDIANQFSAEQLQDTAESVLATEFSKALGVYPKPYTPNANDEPRGFLGALRRLFSPRPANDTIPHITLCFAVQANATPEQERDLGIGMTFKVVAHRLSGTALTTSICTALNTTQQPEAQVTPYKWVIITNIPS